VKAIEYLDTRLIAPIVKGLEAAGEEFRMVILPDHPTPICIRTHAADDVPYLLYDSTRQRKMMQHYNEKEAAETGNYIAEGHKLIEYLLTPIFS
jgi:2,3-bisphosphoglycerate-independent phosphoglycerate mutase